MIVPLPVGMDNFEKLITRGYYFVDKTLFIKELLDKRGDVNLFTRPRRFGKTLNMSMLRYFLEDARDEEGKKIDFSSLFQGLKILEAGETYINHMGKYPVIDLSLKSAKQPDFHMAYQMLCRQIAEEYERHVFILKDKRLAEERERYLLIMRGQADRSSYNDSLRFLSRCLEKYYGQKVILLIDEYDVPLENAYMRGFYTEMMDFIRSLFESALKTNAMLEFAVITGCLRISKESIFTGMNNLKMISILNEKYDEYFGFTDGEVKKLCMDYGMPQKYDAFREWYNGYLFGGSNVYNPWSVIQYMDDLQENMDCFPEPYWANTSSNSIVRHFIEQADLETREEIEALIEGKTLVKPIHEDVSYAEIDETIENLWNFMFFTGYFRKVRAWMDEKDNCMVELAIPNREVKYIFRNKVRAWFQEQVKERDRTRLFQALVQKDTDVLEEEISDMLMQTISFNDAYESFYHGFLAGVFSGMQGYLVKSNREGGRGRSDLVIKPVSRKKTAYVLEFKIAQKMSALEEKAEDALRQIAEKGYAKELYDDEYAAVVPYGIAFKGKDCLVRVGD